MKRLVPGAALFLCLTATSGSRLLACNNDRPISQFRTSIFRNGDNTVLITDDSDIVTVIVYTNTEAHADWM